MLREVGFGGEFHVPLRRAAACCPRDLTTARRGISTVGVIPTGTWNAATTSRASSASSPRWTRACARGQARFASDRSSPGWTTSPRRGCWWSGAAQDTCRPDDTTDLFTRPGVEAWSSQRWTIAVARWVGPAAIGETGACRAAQTGGDDHSDQLSDEIRGPRPIRDCGLEVSCSPSRTSF